MSKKIRAPTIAIHGVSNYAREGAPEPETVTVAKITRPGTPETASPAVKGPNKIRIESEDAGTRHPCAMAGPKQTRRNDADSRNRTKENEYNQRQHTTTGRYEWAYANQTEPARREESKRPVKRNRSRGDHNPARERAPSRRETTTATQQQRTHRINRTNTVTYGRTHRNSNKYQNMHKYRSDNPSASEHGAVQDYNRNTSTGVWERPRGRPGGTAKNQKTENKKTQREGAESRHTTTQGHYTLRTHRRFPRGGCG